MERIALLLLAAACGSSMEMRETVERMVMVRTTGSDLQPAATGYIYRKDDDGPGFMIKMGEHEVMEELSKLYEEPESFKAPAPAAAGPFHGKEDDGNKAASHAKESYVIPVVEKQEEDDKKEDGHGDDGYGKYFGKYASDFGDHKGFDDYLHSLGHFKDGVYHSYGGGKEYGAKGHHEHGEKEGKGYDSKGHFEKGEAGHYGKGDQESFKYSKEGGHKKDYDEADSYGEHYGKGHSYKGGDHGHKVSHSKGEKVEGFHKVYDKNEFKKDHDFYGDEAHKGKHHKFAGGHEYHDSGAGKFQKGDSHESKLHKGGFGKGGFVKEESGEEKGAAYSAGEKGGSGKQTHGDIGAKEGAVGGKSFGYEIKH